MVDAVAEGDIIMLESTRFFKEETKNEPEFVEKLAAPFDIFFNDALGTARQVEWVCGIVDAPFTHLCPLLGRVTLYLALLFSTLLMISRIYHWRSLFSRFLGCFALSSHR